MITDELRTDRLLLRPITLARAEAILTGSVPDGESWAPDYPLADEIGLLRLVLAAGTEPQGWGPWQVLDRPRGPRGPRAIGGLGFLGTPDETGQVEVGFGLVPAVRGAGLAAEALVALVAWALGHGATTVVGHTTVDNLASQRTMINAGLRAAGAATVGSGLEFTTG